ncbi:MAG TPA: hypothetical protein VK530_05380 [Candidatus Acidoferrum sp.]|nr:hypothetical protein [Candidatus Acidoferrum sp.]
MKTHTSPRPWFLASLVLAPLVPMPLYAADNDPISRVRLEEPKEDLNRISVSYSAGWNFKADFKHSNPGRNRGPGPATGGNVDRFYDDGYNRVDRTDNGGGITSFWGYKNESQVDLPNDRILMHSTRATGGTIKDVEDDPQHGFQLTFNRELTRSDDNKRIWGLEAAFGWTFLNIDDDRPARAGTRTITDAFNLNAVEPPFVGGEPSTEYIHQGTFNGPGSLIDSAPTRTITGSANGAIITGSRELDADFYYFHIGPYLELPIAEKWSAVLSAGLSIGIMDGHLHFNERVTVPSAGTSVRQRGDVDQLEVLVGGYLSATIRYEIDADWSVFAGGQYQGMTSYEASGRGREVTLDMTATPFAVVGASYTF